MHATIEHRSVPTRFCAGHGACSNGADRLLAAAHAPSMSTSSATPTSRTPSKRWSLEARCPTRPGRTAGPIADRENVVRLVDLLDRGRVDLTVKIETGLSNPEEACAGQCAGPTRRREKMEVFCAEGSATSGDSESCVHRREAVDEALTGVGPSRVVSRERKPLRIQFRRSSLMAFAGIVFLACTAKTTAEDNTSSNGTGTGGAGASAMSDASGGAARSSSGGTGDGTGTGGAGASAGSDASGGAARPSSAGAAGGAVQPEPVDPGSDVVTHSDSGRALAEPSEVDKVALSSATSAFGFALFPHVRRLAGETENFAFSPVSITLALAMTYAGARGNTAAQMKEVLHITTSDEVYLQSLNWLDRELASRADAAVEAARKRTEPGMSAPEASSFRLHVVNALWGEKTVHFEAPYLDTLASNFGAGIHTADFANQPEAARLMINSWVSQETLDRINDVIPPGAIDSSTRWVLANAVHLKLPWLIPFLEEATRTDTFTMSDGSKLAVPFMHGGGYLSYAESDGLQAVAIPLEGRQLDFMVLLPSADSSLAQLEDGLTSTSAQALLEAMVGHAVTLSLPKFQFTTPSMAISDALQALGMTDAFGSSADLTGITKETPLAISHLGHKAMVGVDEQGVEAAAATENAGATGGPPTDIKEMYVNRPFFFGIYDRPTSTWLFLGDVVAP
jgi:serpin B